MANITALGQDLAQVATVAAIDIGAKDNAEKLARALTAQAVAGVFTSASKGDVAAVQNDVTALVNGITDPGIKTIAEQLASYGNNLLGANMALVAKTPALGSAVDVLLANIGAGMDAAAQAYITAYGKKAA